MESENIETTPVGDLLMGDRVRFPHGLDGVYTINSIHKPGHGDCYVEIVWPDGGATRTAMHETEQVVLVERRVQPEWAYDLRELEHDLDGSVAPEDVEAIGRVCLKLIQRYAPEGRGVRFMEVWARAWQRVLVQGIHDLQCDASGNELGLMEWIVTGKEPEVKL
jgi:hypothetical protein